MGKVKGQKWEEERKDTKKDIRENGKRAGSTKTCYRCGRDNHLIAGCRAKTDHKGTTLEWG